MLLPVLVERELEDLFSASCGWVRWLIVDTAVVACDSNSDPLTTSLPREVGVFSCSSSVVLHLLRSNAGTVNSNLTDYLDPSSKTLFHTR